MDLKELLESYKDITIKLIDKIGEDEEIDVLFDEREKIIQNIGKISFTKEEFQSLSNNLEILPSEKSLQEKINLEKIKIRNKLKSINITKEARMKYENTQFKPTFFYKKI